jgi:hypothetical protein
MEASVVALLGALIIPDALHFESKLGNVDCWK